MKIIFYGAYIKLLIILLVINRKKHAEGFSFDNNIDGNEIQTPPILIGVLSIYSGFVMMLCQDFKKWMTDSHDSFLWLIWILMVLICNFNIYLIFYQRENPITQIITCVSPWPIICPIFSMLLYPIKWGTKRKMYYSETIYWPGYVHTGTPIIKLLNSRWKWILTILMLSSVIFLCLMIFEIMNNTYPLILTSTISIIFYIFGVGTKIQDGMLKRIKDNRVNSKDMMILPMFSHGTNTSALCIKFLKNEIKVSRRQCLWEELPVLAEAVEEKKFEIYNDILKDDDINDEFERKWKIASDVIRNYGSHCVIKGDFRELEEKILLIINYSHVFRKYSSKLYCMTKAMIYSTLLRNVNNNSNAKSW